jgi:head-tail adaptor
VSYPPILNRKLELQNRVLNADGGGGFDISWEPVGTLWGAIDARRGSERAHGNRLIPTIDYKITVRAAPYGAPSRPKPDQRLVENERIYSILAVSEQDPSGLYLEVWAQEGADDQ